jgi:pimeloyl-ACP methyl ester carboxylesterase
MEANADPNQIPALEPLSVKSEAVSRAAPAPSGMKSSRHLARWILLTPVSLTLGVLALGATYQAVKSRADALRFPQEGRSIDVGGFRLNLNCTGQGHPTVILEAGLTVPAISWRPVQREVSGFARVCSYDRAGYDWSDPGPLPRTSERSMRELHTLLHAAGESPPYLLVGHSFGGTNVRIYNWLYSDDVAGMILVEPGHEDLKLPDHVQQAFDATVRAERAGLARGAFLYRFGFSRFQARNRIDNPGLPFDKQEWAYFDVQPKYHEAVSSELENLDQGKADLRKAGTLGDKPLTVLIAKESLLDLPLPDEDKADMNKTWVEMEKSLAKLSGHGRWVIVDGTTHMVPLERPDAIVAAIREMAGGARAH